MRTYLVAVSVFALFGAGCMDIGIQTRVYEPPVTSRPMPPVDVSAGTSVAQPEIPTVKVFEAADLESCDPGYFFNSAKAVQAVQPQAFEEMKLTAFVKEGYEVQKACYDRDSKLAVSMLAKPVGETCEGRCDADVFAVYDPTYKTAEAVASKQQLGFYAESYTSYCPIDKVLAGKTVADTSLLLYCGTGEDGGMTRWYRYDFKTDRLTLARHWEQDGFVVDDQKLLDQFTNKKNSDLNPNSGFGSSD